MCLPTEQAGRSQMITGNTTSTLIIVVILIVVILAVLAVVRRQQRSKRLQERFGPEYDHVIDEVGNQSLAEKELEERVAHVKTLNIRPLTADEVNRYALEWQDVQRQFVDEPLTALQKADLLIQEVMKVRGYPVDDFEQRAADISVDYPELVTDYRGMHRIAVKDGKDKPTTEDMRQVMVHGRALFENLIKQDSTEDVNQKEKM
jgi:hypothetical protein